MFALLSQAVRHDLSHVRRTQAIRRIRRERAAAKSALDRARRDHKRGRYASGDEALDTVTRAVRYVAYLDSQARLIDRGDKEAILRVLDPVAYLEPFYDRAYARLLERELQPA